MMKDTKTGFEKIIAIIPVITILIMAILYFVCFRNLTVEQLLNYSPDNIYLAALVIILLFGLKSMTYVFPMLILFLLSGRIFPVPIALIINIIGTVVMTLPPYLIGRFAEKDVVDRMLSKNKKTEKIKELISDNEFFVSYILRAVNCLPYDIVSLVLGSVNTKTKNYVLGSLLGTLPGLVATTILGDMITDISSPKFWIALGAEIVIMILSLVIYIIYKKKITVNKHLDT